MSEIFFYCCTSDSQMFLPFFNSKIYYVYIDSDKGWNDRGRFLPSDPFQIIQRKRKNKNLFHVFISSADHLEMEADLKKAKNITTLLVRLSSVKRVPVAKEKGVEGAFPWRDEIVAARLETFPPNALDLSPLSPSFLHPRTPSSGQGVRREKKRKSDRKMEKNKERYKKMQHAWIRVQHGLKQRGCIYIRTVLCRSGEGNARERKRNEFLSGSPSAQHKSRRLSFTRTFTLRALRC